MEAGHIVASGARDAVVRSEGVNAGLAELQFDLA